MPLFDMIGIGQACLIVGVGLVVAFAALNHGRGPLLFLVPAIVTGWALVRYVALPVMTQESSAEVTSTLLKRCEQAESKVYTVVQGVNELYVEHMSSEPRNVAEQLGFGLQHVGNGIASPLLREPPRFKRIVIFRSYLTQTGSVEGYQAINRRTMSSPSPLEAGRTEDLPRYGLRWRRVGASQDGIIGYRLEIFDRETKKILGEQTNFKLQSGDGNRPRICPITDPADFVRVVLVPENLVRHELPRPILLLRIPICRSNADRDRRHSDSAWSRASRAACRICNDHCVDGAHICLS